MRHGWNPTPGNIFAILFIRFEKATGLDTQPTGPDEHSAGTDTHFRARCTINRDRYTFKGQIHI
jgi:hypothetical protein